MFGLEIATLLLGISFIAAGMIQSRKTGQKKWRILMIIGIIPVLVSVFLLVCTFWLLYGIQVQEPVAGPTENGKIITENTDAEPEPGSGSDSNIPGSDWRTYRAYSEDLHLDDKGALIFCLSPLDNKNGYAVYDSAKNDREHIDQCFMVTDQGWLFRNEIREGKAVITATRNGLEKDFPVIPFEETFFDRYAKEIKNRDILPADLPDIREAYEDLRILLEN